MREAERERCEAENAKREAEAKIEREKLEFIIIIIISVLEPVFLYRGLGFLTSLPRRRPLHSERF